MTGPGAAVFASAQANRIRRPGVWISLSHQTERLMPWGFSVALMDRLLLVRPGSEIDLLWTAEEAGTGAVSLVIAQPTKSKSLIAGRRLQLAAETGRTTGVVIIQDGAGSNAAETR